MKKGGDAFRFFMARSAAIFIIFFIAYTWACFSGCGQQKAPTDGTRSGGTLYFGVEAPFHGFEVLGTSGFINPTQAPLNNLIMEPLFRMDKTGNLIPVLGLTATPSTNGSIWDINFVKASSSTTTRRLPLMRSSTTGREYWIPKTVTKVDRPFQPIRSVEKIDDYKVRFNLDHPWPPFLKVISDELFLFNFIPSPTAVDAGTHDRKPVGTGPFKYHKWNSGDHFVVLRNDRYWQKEKPVVEQSRLPSGAGPSNTLCQPVVRRTRHHYPRSRQFDQKSPAGRSTVHVPDRRQRGRNHFDQYGKASSGRHPRSPRTGHGQQPGPAYQNGLWGHDSFHSPSLR